MSSFSRVPVRSTLWVIPLILNLFSLPALAMPPLTRPPLAGEPPGNRSTPGPTARFPNGRVFQLEIAATPAERSRGYMYREKVGQGEGMLFLFPEVEFHSFWMKNCRVPLDIIWLDEELRIVHIETEVPPCRQDPCTSYPPMRMARYVLEVKAGTVRRAGLRLSDRISLEGVEGVPTGPR